MDIDGFALCTVIYIHLPWLVDLVDSLASVSHSPLEMQRTCPLKSYDMLTIHINYMVNHMLLYAIMLSYKFGTQIGHDVFILVYMCDLF